MATFDRHRYRRSEAAVNDPETYQPPWERDWERAKTLGLPEPAPLDPGQREFCRHAPHSNLCPNPATSVFVFPSGRELTYACDVHKARAAAIVGLMFEVRRQNSLWGRLTFRRLRNREYKAAPNDLLA